MASRSAKRKRDDLERTLNDDSSEVSESGTSGSSFKLSDCGEDTDSSSIDNNLDTVNCAARKGGNKAKKVDCEDFKENSSTQKVKKAKTSMGKGGIQLDKRLSCAAGSLSSGRSSANEDISIGGKSGFTKHDRKVIERACKRLSEGASCRIVADELGLSETTIRGWRTRYIPEDKRKELNAQRLCNNEKIIEACKLMKKGVKTQSLAKRFGVSQCTIVSWRKRFAPETVRARYDNHTILEACRQLKEDNLKAVALKMGIHPKKVESWEKRFLLTKIETTTLEGSWTYDRYTKLEACCRLRQGHILETIAEELDVHISVLLKWKSENTLEIITQPEDEKKYDKNFILDVCNRLVRGESPPSIAKSLKITKKQVYVWKQKYCTSGRPEPSEGLKCDKEIVRRACELLKSGENVPTVARKLQVSKTSVYLWKRKYVKETNTKQEEFHSFATVLKLLKYVQYKTKRRVLEVYKLLKQGQSIKTIATKLKADPTEISNWKFSYIVKGNEDLKDTTEYPDKIVQQVYEGFSQGDTLYLISIKSGIKRRTLNYWHYQYLEQVLAKFLEKTSSVGKIDEKLKFEPFIVLEKNQKIDQLGQIHSSGRRAISNLPVDGATIERACKRFRNGAPARIVAKEFGITVNRAMAWRRRNLSKEERVLKKSSKVTNEQISEACRLLKQGAKMSVLAKRYGVREETISAWKSRYVSDTSRLFRSNMKYDVETILKVCRQLNNGDSKCAISRSTGINVSTLKSWQWKYLLAKTHESTSEGSWKFIKYTKLQAYQKIKQGIAADVIAKELNVDEKLVDKWKNESAKRWSQRVDGALFDRHDKEEVLKRLRRGHKVPQISKCLGLSYSTVYNYGRWYVRKKFPHLITSDSNLGLLYQVQKFLNSGDKFERKTKRRKLTRIFIPFRKVYIPNRMKLKFVKMIDDGVSIEKLSKELKINGLTLQSWIFNRELLGKHREQRVTRNC